MVSRPGTTRELTGRRLLVVLWDGGGNTFTVLTMVGHFRSAGAEVTVLTNPSLRDRVLRTGARFVPYEHGPHHDPRTPAGDALRFWEAADPAHAARLLRDRVLFGPAAGIAADVVSAAREWGADLVVADYILFGALAAAESLGVPHVAFMDSIYPLPPEGAPRGLAVRAGPFATLFARTVRAGAEQFAKVRADLGLDPLDSPAEQYDRADALFIASLPSFDAAAPYVPAHARYVGPQISGPSAPAAAVRPPGLPGRIVVSLATAHQPAGPPLVRKLVAALRNGPMETTFLGGCLDVAGTAGEPSGHIRGRGFVPLEELLPHTDLVVTHGGYGTTVRSLLWGVPTLVLPSGQDEFNNGRRAAHLGAGLVGNREDSPQRLREAVLRLLGEPRFRAGARAAAEVLRAENNPRASVEAVAELLGAGGR